MWTSATTRMKTASRILVVIALLLILSACAMKAGEPFPVEHVTDIEIGETTRADIRQMFGEPWRTGIENGDRTWTYGEYKMDKTRDLKIRFDDRSVVKSYSFSSSFPEDKNL